jgi:hypothetical protein
MSTTPYFIRTCQHIKTNGIRCGSPAMRRSPFCYFHKRWRDLRPRRYQRSVTLPSQLAHDVEQLALRRHLPWPQMVVELIETGLVTQEAETMNAPPPQPEADLVSV